MAGVPDKAIVMNDALNRGAGAKGCVEYLIIRHTNILKISLLTQPGRGCANKRLQNTRQHKTFNIFDVDWAKKRIHHLLDALRVSPQMRVLLLYDRISILNYHNSIQFYQFVIITYIFFH